MRYCDTVLCLVLALILELRDGWQYAVTPPGAPMPSVWFEDITPRADQDRWYRVTLPAATPPDAHAVFRSH